MKANSKASLVPAPLWLLLPFAIMYLMFWIIPLLRGLVISFSADGLQSEPGFVGLDNYIHILSDARFFHSLGNTLFFALASIITIVPLSLFLSQLLQRTSRWLREIVVFCLILPGLTAPTVLAFLFVLIFNGEHGILNTLFVHPFGIPTIDWIKDPAFIKISLVLQSIWRWTGFVTFFLLAGLDGIPKSYYEVAKVEGASSLKIFFSVTIPLLKNILIFVCLFLLLDAFILFEGAYILLGSSGGTADAGLLFVGYVYYRAFYLGNFGSAAAMSFSIAPLFILLISILVWKIKRPKEDYV